MQFLLTFGYEWLEFMVRWAHVIVGISWIGSSFYFIALDLGLRKTEHLAPKAHGQQWQVHGGGFYNLQKYLVAPDTLPENLVWFKWESYSTWLSGVALLMLTYYVSADLLLVDPDKLALLPWQAIIISALSIGVGWVIYNNICKSKLGNNNNTLMLLLYVMLVAMAWGYDQIFSGRATFLHLGAFTATIMTANVFFIIIPNQKHIVTTVRAHKEPDPKYRETAKQRSIHNNYLTLPVIFFMISNHYPLAFATEYNWVIAALIFLMGVSIRHFFNYKHGKNKDLWWCWAITALLLLAIIALSTQTGKLNVTPEEEATATLRMNSQQEYLYEHQGYQYVKDTMQGRCSMCHSREPFYSENMLWAPKNTPLETDGDILKNAKKIYLHAGLTKAMPPANVSFMEDTERQAIIDWYEASLPYRW